MRHMTRLILATITALLPHVGAANAEVPGQFDYWVLALSWSPAWCETRSETRARDDGQCDPGAGRGFTVHGLWPQYDRGWPEFCPTNAAAPLRRESAAMADLMGSASLAFYQWRKHGVCSGLSGRHYYDTTREAAAAITVPEVFSAISRPLRVPVAVIEDAFIEVNPGLARDGITVTCKDGMLSEIRICLDHELRPRSCTHDAARDCRLSLLDLPALR